MHENVLLFWTPEADRKHPFLFTVATSATWTSFNVSKNELHSPLTSTLLGTISMKISNYYVLIYWNAMLQIFKRIISCVAAPGCLYLLLSYRWFSSYWLFNAKPDGSVLFSLLYVHACSSPLVWDVWGKSAWIFEEKNAIFWHNVYDALSPPFLSHYLCPCAQRRW